MNELLSNPLPLAKRLELLVQEVKNAGKGRKYDCILGVSGGTDSTFLAWWAHKEGLRPLLVHMDNGWNSDLAVSNIERISSTFGWELHTYVINWEEFKHLQLAYLYAGVVDVEIPTDHAIVATVYKLAKKYNIKYVLSGFNLVTEGVMPKDWNFRKLDYENIRSIYKAYGKGPKLKTYPKLTFWKSIYYRLFVQIESIQPLNYMNYNKSEAQEIIKRDIGWKDYGGKHHESLFTKFYQVYILPRKFGIDKRKCHLAALICSGQLSREEAFEVLSKPQLEKEQLAEEKRYVLKKLELSENEFEKIMISPVRRHDEFRTDKELWDRYFKFIGFVNRLNIMRILRRKSTEKN